MLLGGRWASPTEHQQMLSRGRRGFLVNVPLPTAPELFGVREVLISSSTLLPMELRKFRNALIREVGESWRNVEIQKAG